MNDNTFTYSHYEKVTISINRKWWQKLLLWPKEVSQWNRRSWVIKGEENARMFSEVMMDLNQSSTARVELSMHQLEQSSFNTRYIKTTENQEI